MKPIAITLALIIAFLRGLSPVMHKDVLGAVTPRTMMVMSSVFYSVCVIVYFLYYRRTILPEIMHLNTRSLVFIAFTAIVCGFFTNVLYFHILKRYESYIVSALIYSSPVFTLIMAYLFLQEKITPVGFFGVIFITLGVVMLAFNKSGAEPFGTLE